MNKHRLLPFGVPCLLIVLLLFGYMGLKMGLTNMLNTIMNTAHDLLLNTVFYLMGMCVVTGALGKIFTEFGVVNLLQKALKPVMRPVFHMPGVASLGAILTFLSDNPAIIALSKDRAFARYFKKFEHVSLVNFGTAFGMGLLVIVFMMGQGYYAEPFIGFAGAMCGCVIATRLMQYFTCKDFPNYRYEDAISAEEQALLREEKAKEEAKKEEKAEGSTFVHVLNALLDGGRDGVTIGLAIIPGVLIISTLVMMLTFGGSTEGVDEMGEAIVVYTGEAYQGTQLLPWLAGQLGFVFEWLFGFTAPELVSFPITALGAVGAALGLIPEFVSKGIIDGNAIAVFTAMGMCWSGYLSTDAATLDSLGYRSLVPRAFVSTFVGGICAGIITHWMYVGIMALASLFAPKAVWTTAIEAYPAQEQQKAFNLELEAYDDSTYTIRNWYGVEGCDLRFSVNQKDSTLNIHNAYANRSGYYFVRINNEKHRGEAAYAALYPGRDYSEFEGQADKGRFYVFTIVYDGERRLMTRGYYEVVWGGAECQVLEAERLLREEMQQERKEAIHEADSLRLEQMADSIIGAKYNF